MCCHGPTNDLAAPHVQHNGQIEEAHPRRNVRDVGDPERVGPIGHELPVAQIGSLSRRAITPRRHGPFPPAHSCQAGLLHQPSHAFAPDGCPFFAQLRVNARRSVRLARSVMNGPYPLLKLFVLSLSCRHHTPAPGVVPAGGDLQHSAHRPDREHGLVRVYEEEDLFDFFSVSPANQAAAFDRISRSSLRRAFSRRKRASSSRSLVVRPAVRSPSSSSACRSHLRIACAVGSNSFASASGDRPSRANRTSSCCNSTEYRFRFAIVDSSQHPQVSTKPGQLQNMAFHPHAHCVVPCGGVSEDGSRWISFEPRDLPSEGLSRRFGALLRKGIQAAARRGELDRLPETVSVEQLLASLNTRECSVYAKPPHGGPEKLLEYLARYVYRVAIRSEEHTSELQSR